MIGFVVGAVAGGVIVWLWGDRMRQIAQDTARQTRARSAAGLDSAQARAEGVMDHAKEQIRSGIQAGREYIRPSDPEGPGPANTSR